MRICVYSAIYGEYDALKQPVAQSQPCDWLLFTDAAMPSPAGAWRVVRSLHQPQLTPRMRARYLKINSHLVFPGGRLAWRFAPFAAPRRYDVVIWADACLQIKSPDFVAGMLASIGPSGWTMFIHPDRDCIYDELEAARYMKRCLDQPLAEQVAHYKANGFPAHAGLMATTTIARRTRDPRLARINEAWWQEMMRWSNRDQLSLPVVLRRLGMGYDQIKLDLWKNDWFDWIEHQVNR